MGIPEESNWCLSSLPSGTPGFNSQPSPPPQPVLKTCPCVVSCAPMTTYAVTGLSLLTRSFVHSFIHSTNLRQTGGPFHGCEGHAHSRRSNVQRSTKWAPGVRWEPRPPGPGKGHLIPCPARGSSQVREGGLLVSPSQGQRPPVSARPAGSLCRPSQASPCHRPASTLVTAWTTAAACSLCPCSRPPC